MEKYLLLLPSHYRVWIKKIGTSDLKLPIGVGRWYGIAKENRFCTFYLKNIDDEFHVLFNCENDVISAFRNNSYPAIIVKTQPFKKWGGGCFQTVIFNY